MGSKARCSTKQRHKSYTQIKQNKSLIDSATHKKRQCSAITTWASGDANVLAIFEKAACQRTRYSTHTVCTNEYITIVARLVQSSWSVFFCCDIVVRFLGVNHCEILHSCLKHVLAICFFLWQCNAQLILFVRELPLGNMAISKEPPVAGTQTINLDMAMSRE